MSEIIQIEKWTNMKVSEIVFDSKKHNWKEDKSVFDQLILNKQNLIFLIETEDNIKFGGFISSKIDKIRKFISDENAYVFTFKDNNPMKFDINKYRKYDAFYLFNKLNYCLFEIGYEDIFIFKHNQKSNIFQ